MGSGTAAGPEADPSPGGPAFQRGRRLSTPLLLFAIVICVVATAVGVAVAGGIVAGQSERSFQATETTTADLVLQYSLGQADLQAGNYGLAAERFNWILARDPDYPGAAEGLAEARRLAAAGTPSATALPTSQASTLEELVLEAEQYLAAQQWEIAIARLQDVQTMDPRYREVEIKEMLYEALKTLGLIYVRGERIEEGIFLLEQAETIRPLDDQSGGELLLATLYIEGKTYSGLNWPIAIENFKAIYEVAPGYRDVENRLWQGYSNYGDQLALAGGFCDAAEQYQSALTIRQDDDLQASLEQSAAECANPTPTPTPTQALAGTPQPSETPPAP
jgi:tetratricopeptide (TPR) repeat protein